jgi:hypothetical protein
MQDFQFGDARGKLGEDRPSAVRGLIVHDYDFYNFGLRRNGFDRAGDRGFFVACRNDGGNHNFVGLVEEATPLRGLVIVG